MGRWLAGLGRVLRDSVWGWDGYPRLLPKARPWVHLTLLALVITVVDFAVLAATQAGALAEARREFAALPDFGVRDGQFWADIPQPYTEDLGEGGVLLIDTTGKLGPDDLAAHPSGFLIMKDAAYYKRNEMQTDVYRFSGLKGLDVDKDQLLRALDRLYPYLAAFGTILAFAWNWVRLGVDAAILSVVLLIVAAASSRRVTWGGTFATSAYALTLPAGIGLIPSYRLDWLVFWGAALAYGVGGMLRAHPRYGSAAAPTPAPDAEPPTATG